MTATTTYRVRLVKAGAGTKLHLMYDRSENNGETWFTGSALYCGSSPYAPRTVVSLVGTGLGDTIRALRASLTDAQRASLCKKCGC